MDAASERLVRRALGAAIPVLRESVAMTDAEDYSDRIALDLCEAALAALGPAPAAQTVRPVPPAR